MTTAASFRSVTDSNGAGAPGFEPGIAGPKPAALPLGYAPPRASAESLGSIGEEGGKRGQRQDCDCDQGQRSNHEHEDRDERHEGLRDARDPRNLMNRVGANVP